MALPAPGSGPPELGQQTFLLFEAPTFGGELSQATDTEGEPI